MGLLLHTTFCAASLLATVEAGKVSVTKQSSAGCKVSVGSSSRSLSVEVAADAAADATAYICGDTRPVAEVNAVAESTAYAAASAIANATAECYATGNGSFKARGQSRASAEAHAYAEAYAEGTVAASVCGKCNAAAEFLAHSWSEIFLKAVAEAEVHLEAAANGKSITAASSSFVEAVADATVTAYAQVIATATASVDAGCDVSILGAGITGDQDDPDGVVCELAVSGKDLSVAVDAISKAAAELKVYTCDGEIAIEVVSESYGKAIAVAISEVLLDCFVKGEGYACALGDAEIETVATATAEAFASAAVEAVTGCGCSLSEDSFASSLTQVTAEAASRAYEKECTGSNSHFDIEKLSRDVAAASLSAISKVIVKAVSDGENCSATIETDTKTEAIACTDCVGKWKKCGGKGIPKVLACCDSGFSCYKANKNYMQCRRDGGRIKPSWDGSIVPCGA